MSYYPYLFERNSLTVYCYTILSYDQATTSYSCCIISVNIWSLWTKQKAWISPNHPFLLFCHVFRTNYCKIYQKSRLFWSNLIWTFWTMESFSMGTSAWYGGIFCVNQGSDSTTKWQQDVSSRTLGMLGEGQHDQAAGYCYLDKSQWIWWVLSYNK